MLQLDFDFTKDGYININPGTPADIRYSLNGEMFTIQNTETRQNEYVFIITLTGDDNGTYTSPIRYPTTIREYDPNNPDHTNGYFVHVCIHDKNGRQKKSRKSKVKIHYGGGGGQTRP